MIAQKQMRLRCTAVLGLITLLCALGAAQNRLRVDVRLVNVFATITDVNGHYVDGLNSDDFVLQEDGVSQEIAHFSHELDVPVSVGIVLDTSGSMRNKLRTAVTAVDRFVRTIHPNDDIFLMTFASSLELRQDFTDDRDKLSRALRRTNASGSTLLYDALRAGLIKVKSGKHPKRAILLITDGQDTGSEATLDEILNEIGESELLVYTLGISPASSADSTRDSVDVNVLQNLASNSGGRAFMLSDVLVGTFGREIDKVLTMVATELRSQYTLGFYATHADDGKFHSLRIKTRPGLVARSRPGYIARPALN
jgi:Ca-activated chloride channel homolog